MALRDDILTNVITRLSGSNVSVSSQLPYISGDVPLHVKNMKTLYVNEQEENITELYATLGDDVFTTETTIEAYLCTDAKTQPGDIDSIVSNVLLAKNDITGNVISRESEVEVDYQDDKIIYTFEYRFQTI